MHILSLKAEYLPRGMGASGEDLNEDLNLIQF